MAARIPRFGWWMPPLRPGLQTVNFVTALKGPPALVASKRMRQPLHIFAPSCYHASLTPP